MKNIRNFQGKGLQCDDLLDANKTGLDILM